VLPIATTAGSITVALTAVIAACSLALVFIGRTYGFATQTRAAGGKIPLHPTRLAPVGASPEPCREGGPPPSRTHPGLLLLGDFQPASFGNRTHHAPGGDGRGARRLCDAAPCGERRLDSPHAGGGAGSAWACPRLVRRRRDRQPQEWARRRPPHDRAADRAERRAAAGARARLRRSRDGRAGAVACSHSCQWQRRPESTHAYLDPRPRSGDGPARGRPERERLDRSAPGALGAARQRRVGSRRRRDADRSAFACRSRCRSCAGNSHRSERRRHGRTGCSS
jgi:hypothetical protein